MNASRHPRPRNVDELRSAWRHEMATSRAERDADSRWQRLERAHILRSPDRSVGGVGGRARLHPA